MLRRLLMGLILVMLVSPAFGQEVLVFVTSDTHPADMPPTGGVAGGDERCTNTAQAANLTGNWTAWLSSSTEDARDRIIDAQYVMLNGTVIADDLGDLTDGTLDNPLIVDQDGQTILEAGSIWTGTREDGTAGEVCQDWTVNAGNTGTYGTLGETDPAWTKAFDSGCGIVRRLYCFSDYEVPVELEEFSVE